MAERLTAERLAELRDEYGGLDPEDVLFGHIDSQQVEIDRLLKANDYLRGQIFRGPGACYCVCHNPLSSCGYCQHCKGDNSVGEFHRLRALLGEALTALRHVETDTWLDCCRNAIAPVLAKLAQEGDRG